MTGAMIDGSTRYRPAGAAEAPRPAAPLHALGGPAESSVPSLLVLFGNQPASRRAAEDRLVALLDAWIVDDCRSSIARRLVGLTDAARAAMLPSAAARAALAGKVLAELQPSILLGLLSAEIESERTVLLHQAGSPDRMLREAALDALCSIRRVGHVTARVQQGCQMLLEPGFALLGVDHRAVLPDATDGDRGPATARDATILDALRRDDLDTVMRLLSVHAGIGPALVADAVWTRDARSLFGLAWRAGYSTRTAVLLQSQLAGVPRPSALVPGENGVSPMGSGEIAWQLTMLERT